MLIRFQPSTRPPNLLSLRTRRYSVAHLVPGTLVVSDGNSHSNSFLSPRKCRYSTASGTNRNSSTAHSLSYQCTINLSLGPHGNRERLLRRNRYALGVYRYQLPNAPGSAWWRVLVNQHLECRSAQLYLMNVCGRYLTFVPFVLQPAPSRSHTMFVVPQHTLASGERGVMATLETPRLTGHIQAHGAPHPGRSLASKPQGREQR